MSKLAINFTFLSYVPNAPCGVESFDVGSVVFVRDFHMFLMHRVELKAPLRHSKDKLFILVLFLMHRVELKVGTPLTRIFIT